jgi:uncharacterized protein YggE
MFMKKGPAALVLLAGSVACGAQQAAQVQMKIDSTNRTINVSGSSRVTADPEVAILHIGFETQLTDAKTAYADGSRISNAIVGALKQAGIPETSIRSEMQHLDRDFTKPHRFKLVQEWTVKAPPERAAEILDVAIGAGATSSGQIDWDVRDEHALENQALEEAAERAKGDAGVLAKGMGVRLGALIYASNQVSTPVLYRAGAMNNSLEFSKSALAPAPLSIEPSKVSREATVYAVFAIE